MKSGDTLSKIAQENGVSVADILKANPDIDNPDVIKAGQKIIIPYFKTVAPESIKKEEVKNLAPAPEEKSWWEKAKSWFTGGDKPKVVNNENSKRDDFETFEEMESREDAAEIEELSSLKEWIDSWGDQKFADIKSRANAKVGEEIKACKASLNFLINEAKAAEESGKTCDEISDFRKGVRRFGEYVIKAEDAARELASDLYDVAKEKAPTTTQVLEIVAGETASLGVDAAKLVGKGYLNMIFGYENAEQGAREIGRIARAVWSEIDKYTTVEERKAAEALFTLAGTAKLGKALIKELDLSNGFKLQKVDFNKDLNVLSALGQNQKGEIEFKIWDAGGVTHYEKWDKYVEFKSTRVYQRDDLIDPNRINPDNGRTSLESMKQGFAPTGPDGKPVNLHHLIQSERGGIAEVTETMHKEYTKILHINPNKYGSGIDRTEFEKWKRSYWKNRAKEHE